MKVQTENQAYRVRWQYDDYAPMPNSPTNRKATYCFIQVADTDDEYIGTALCNYKDQFSKEEGRVISLERAMDNAQMNEPQKKLFRKEYYTSIGARERAHLKKQRQRAPHYSSDLNVLRSLIGM